MSVLLCLSQSVCLLTTTDGHQKIADWYPTKQEDPR